MQIHAVRGMSEVFEELLLHDINERPRDIVNDGESELQEFAARGASIPVEYIADPYGRKNWARRFLHRTIHVLVVWLATSGGLSNEAVEKPIREASASPAFLHRRTFQWNRVGLGRFVVPG